MRKRLMIATLAGAILPSPILAATYSVGVSGIVRSVEGDTGGRINIGDRVAANFTLNDRDAGSPDLLPIGSGLYSIYQATLTDFRFILGTYRIASSNQSGILTYMDDSFGQDGIVISPDALSLGSSTTDHILAQFQFRGSTDAIGSAGIGNGLPLYAFQPSFFAIIQSTAGTNRVFGDVSVSISSMVPEPSIWAMVIIGFGAIGAMARNRPYRQVST